MNTDRELIELMDDYVREKLSPSQAAAFELRMSQDETLRQKVEAHRSLIHSFVEYGKRKDLKVILDEAHSELKTEEKVIPFQKSVSERKNYWLLTGIAASLAFICIVSTWYVVQTGDDRQAEYKALRRNLDQIQKSQKVMMKDLAEQKEKKAPIPGRYAGTGFLISGKGYIATSYHVIRDADSVHIENSRFGVLTAFVVYNDPMNDISILKIDSTNFSQILPYILVKNEAELAEGVFTLGYPREDIVFGEGAISALSGFRQNPNAYQISVPVNPGNSGGPLLNSNGDLVGMISGIQTETAGTAFAIKSTILLEVLANPALDTLHVPVTLPKLNSIKNTDRVKQVRRWKDFVFMVRVYKN
jgi:S1-C subfamily serine protease